MLNVHRPVSTVSEHLLRRVCGEFLEMPGLSVTPEQARRLWGLDEPTCREVLERLVEARFLARTAKGHYTRISQQPPETLPIPVPA